MDIQGSFTTSEIRPKNKQPHKPNLHTELKWYHVRTSERTRAGKITQTEDPHPSLQPEDWQAPLPLQLPSVSPIPSQFFP